MMNTRAINTFLLDNGFWIKSNPAISPDLCLDPKRLEEAVRTSLPGLINAISSSSNDNGPKEFVVEVSGIDWYPNSEIILERWRLYVVEDHATGDAGLLVEGGDSLPLPGTVRLDRQYHLVPLRWSVLAALKNLIQERDPDSTVFPTARGTLAHTSLGIGARFTTLHWPSVAWVMKTLELSLTANQNSIPRELVYDVDAMLEGRLAKVPFPFIGAAVPEGHQGQSVEGMSHASIVSFLKVGFHRWQIPWGFNADHQPIGGRFDAIEEELVRGSVFASYITFDLSPELALYQPIEDPVELERAFSSLAATELFDRVMKRLAPLPVTLDPIQARRLFVYLLPAMTKLKRRDEAYQRIRCELFSTQIGRRYYRELSIDELPGRTTPETLALCLALADAFGVEIHFVAPAIGFQKNFPFPDNDELRCTVEALVRIAEKFGVSIGFHSGSGKSALNYRVLGEVTGRHLEIKTSGRYTYEMGVALAHSSDAQDQVLWRDWYEFTRQLAIEGAFADDATRQRLAREFIRHALAEEKRSDSGVFEDPQTLEAVLAGLSPSPDHMFWFEYNFLYVLAAGNSPERLGDHGPAGYGQRARFYRISDEARFAYARGVARYLLFLAEATGLADPARILLARQRLDEIPDYGVFLQDLVQ